MRFWLFAPLYKSSVCFRSFSTSHFSTEHSLNYCPDFRGHYKLSGFNTNLKDFLDNYMESKSQLNQESINNHKDKYTKALQNCIDVFGDASFTNPAAEKKRKGLVHYDLLMLSVGQLDYEVAISKKTEIQQAYLNLCQSDDFKRTLSGGLQNKSSILRRKASWAELLEAAINAS